MKIQISVHTIQSAITNITDITPPQDTPTSEPQIMALS